MSKETPQDDPRLRYCFAGSRGFVRPFSMRCGPTLSAGAVAATGGTGTFNSATDFPPLVATSNDTEAAASSNPDTMTARKMRSMGENVAHAGLVPAERSIQTRHLARASVHKWTEEHGVSSWRSAFAFRATGGDKTHARAASRRFFAFGAAFCGGTLRIGTT